jgi:hypothetical protein
LKRVCSDEALFGIKPLPALVPYKRVLVCSFPEESRLLAFGLVEVLRLYFCISPRITYVHFVTSKLCSFPIFAYRTFLFRCIGNEGETMALGVMMQSIVC